MRTKSLSCPCAGSQSLPCLSLPQIATLLHVQVNHVVQKQPAQGCWAAQQVLYYVCPGQPRLKVELLLWQAEGHLNAVSV